jgi:hypothetical protein
MAGAKIANGSGVNELTMTAEGYVKVALANTDAIGSIGGIRLFSENDDGTVLNTDPQLFSPETDLDYRLRTSDDIMLEDETFNTTAQNTSKYQYFNTTMTNTFAVNGVQTNGTGISTINTGTVFRSYAQFPAMSTQTLSADIEISFSNWAVANTIIDFGFGITPTTPAFTTNAASACTDGIYFSLDPSGLRGVLVYNSGTPVSTPVFTTDGSTPLVLTANKKYQVIIYSHHRVVEFWINNGDTTALYGTIATPAGQGQPHACASLPLFLRHTINGGAAGATQNANLSNWSVRSGGASFSRSLGEFGNAVYGSYQGLSGGTMGQLVAGPVPSGTLVKPTAAVPANTSLVANLPSNLGGRIYEQLTTGLAANVDGVFASYTVPLGGVNQPARRLKVSGIKLSGMVSTVVVGGAAFTEWYIAFGHTADSLATGETATTKAPRRVMLPELTTNMPAAAAAGSLLPQPAYYSEFSEPIYVNPGERIALVGNKTITTAITSGILSYTYQFVYSWE